MPHPAARRTPLASSVLALGLLLSWAGVGQAQPEAPAPVELTEAIAQLDAAATEQDLDAVLQYYSPEFTNTDGMTYDGLAAALESFWTRFSDLTYETELVNWTQEGTALVVETTTTIRGVQAEAGRDMRLAATLTSRQRFEDGKIVQQELLTEQTELRSGITPPTVTINLPDTVEAGAEFAFDAIVQEPLGDRYLLGAAIEEPVNPETYLSPAPVELELLSAGGLFKTAEAPEEAGDRWISAALIREDGITIVTRRLHVVDANPSSP